MSKSALKSALDTPMMRQYLELKARHPDEILFYRMGDFYEMFLEDAKRAAPLLDIALTTRDKGKPDAVPMCGVPVHAADQHLATLARHGLRVAICEQVEDARAVAGKRLVRRDVVEIVTPGLVSDPDSIESAAELSVAALWAGERLGLAVLDASTGELRATQAEPEAGSPPRALLEELRRVAPREVVVPEGDGDLSAWLERELPGVARAAWPADGFDPASAPAHPDGLDPAAVDAAARAAAALLHYVARHQPFALEQAARLRRYALADAMLLDDATRRHLELFRNAEDGGRARTLIERIDLSQTPLGARRLARWLAYPLVDPAAIAGRQEAVGYLAERDRLRGRLREALGPVRDLERRLAKVARPSATPPDLARLRESLEALPGLERAFEADAESLLEAAPPDGVPRPRALPELAGLLRAALADEVRPVPRGSRGALETGYIRAAYHGELDGLREAAHKGREWIAGLEAQERERTGIPALKIRFHPVHGYSIEVSKAQLSRVPEDYERKQTLASAERFTTPALREMESQVRGATERAAALERELFEQVRRTALQSAAEIGAVAEAVGALDALAALAEAARRGGWVRPEVDGGLALEIEGGRHPVVEPLLAGSGESFVPNDTRLDPASRQLLILTGPNMSGKSTYLRQTALLVLLAQIGSFVPADRARIGVVDRVFTRVGASDRLARGESTFMVEMRETADILAHASPRSLIILDEIGRGTSTFDGLSIAWAVVEYLHDTPGLGARTLFATHYHELVDLARPRVANAHFAAREWNDEVVFLRQLLEGGASRSYGIQVARLAGLPTAVTARAREILAQLEAGEQRGAPGHGPAGAEAGADAEAQLGLFAAGPPDPVAAEVLAALRELSIDDTTPRQALALLADLRARAGGEEVS